MADQIQRSLAGLYTSGDHGVRDSFRMRRASEVTGDIILRLVDSDIDPAGNRRPSISYHGGPHEVVCDSRVNQPDAFFR